MADHAVLSRRKTFEPKRKDGAVITATAYGLDDREAGVRVLVGSRISSARFLFTGYLGLFPWGWGEIKVGGT
jgi:hypothetical protein